MIIFTIMFRTFSSVTIEEYAMKHRRKFLWRIQLKHCWNEELSGEGMGLLPSHGQRIAESYENGNPAGAVMRYA